MQARLHTVTALAAGHQVHYHLNELAVLPDTPAKWSVLAAELDRVKAHPALFGYYIADEPGGAGVAPTLLERVYTFVKARDPDHPMTMAFCCCDPTEYAAAFDIGMMDPYPIVSIDDDAVNQQRLVSMVTGAAGTLKATGKPFFMVLQLFGGGEAWQRAPTAAEIRVMAYLSLIHGATGLQYFARSPANAFPNSPLAWHEVSKVALEVAELTPAIAGGPSPQQPTVTGNGSRVDVRSWAGRSEPGFAYTMVAVANTNTTPTALALGGLLGRTSGGSYSGPAEVLNQNRNVSVVAGVLHDVLLGYGTALYRYPPVPWGSGRVLTASNGIINPSFELAANVGSPDGDYLGAPDHADELDGASFLADARTSVDGLHSLRLITPVNGTGYTGGPFPSSLNKGTNYSVSVWAKAAVAGAQLTLAPHGLVVDPRRSNCSAALKCTLGTSWAKFEVVGQASDDTRASPVAYRLETPGTAWLDVLVVKQLNDCPSNGEFGFADLHVPPFAAASTAANLTNTSGCCSAGWVAGEDFQGLCSGTPGWFWWYPNAGPYMCCRALRGSTAAPIPASGG